MAWTSNIGDVLAGLEAKKRNMDSMVAEAANQGLVMGLNEVQALCPVDTGNLKNGYPRDSKVTKIDDCHYQIEWTSIAMNVDYCYQPKVESRKPHLGPGIHAAMPAITENFKKILEG